MEIMENTLSVILGSLLYSWYKRYSRSRLLQTLPLHSSGFLIKENQIRNPNIKNIFLKFFKRMKSSSGTASLKMIRSIMIYAKNTAGRHTFPGWGLLSGVPSVTTTLAVKGIHLHPTYLSRHVPSLLLAIILIRKFNFLPSADTITPFNFKPVIRLFQTYR